MAASSFVPLTKNSQQAFVEYYRSVQLLQNITRETFRARLAVVDRAYQRENNQTKENARAKKANRAGDPSRFQDITVPVVMPQVEANVTYQTSVFLTGYPLFGVVASPVFMDEAMQMESVMEDQSVKGGWARELMLFFRDGAKHNFAPIEVSWKDIVTNTVETVLEKSTTEGIPKQVIWSGNSIKRLDPYNTFLDTRVVPSELHSKGEFAGYTEFISRIELKSRVAALPDKIVANLEPAFKSGSSVVPSQNSSSQDYYIPDINPEVVTADYLRGEHNWMKWAGLASTRNPNLEYKDSYQYTTLYCKVLPSEFGLRVPNRGTPQIYKVILVNHEHIIYAEQQTNAHAFLPILIGQPLEDGLGYQTKSLATNAMPFQDVATSYMGSILASRRRAISDRTLYDPSRITSAQINSPNPSAKIPVRPAAYGKNISEAVYQFPYREDQASSSMAQIQALLGLANTTNGQNQAQQGQFVKGNKTLEEFDTVMANANGREQMSSILLEHQVFVPMKEMLKLNILQYQGGTTVYNREKELAVEIDPVQLRKAVLEFKVSDGLVPSSKLVGGDTAKTALQIIGSSPQIGAAYNVNQLFSYIMKTQGADIQAFEKSPQQQAFEQAMDQWNQLAQLAVSKDVDLKTLPPQPVPADFGYDPAKNKPAPPEASTGTETPPQSPLTSGAP